MLVHEICGNYCMQRVHENSGFQCLSTKFVKVRVACPRKQWNSHCVHKIVNVVLYCFALMFKNGFWNLNKSLNKLYLNFRSGIKCFAFFKCISKHVLKYYARTYSAQKIFTKIICSLFIMY